MATYGPHISGSELTNWKSLHQAPEITVTTLGSYGIARGNFSSICLAELFDGNLQRGIYLVGNVKGYAFVDPNAQHRNRCYLSECLASHVPVNTVQCPNLTPNNHGRRKRGDG